MGDLVPITSTSGVLMVPDRKQQLADYEKRLKEVCKGRWLNLYNREPLL